MSDIKPFIEKNQKSSEFIHEHPLINRIMRNRGVKSPNELEYKLSNLISPNSMMGMNVGTDILIKHIMADSKILVVGDYDCDGATATTIAVEGLKLCGAKNVEFIVPDRGVHGYGLSRPIVELAAKSKPDLIVTVDNGIASFDGAKAVRELNHPCELLITDHHLAVESGELPEAEAIINPNQPDCKFPSKNIAGCGVMFYVIMGLRAKMDEQGYFNKLAMEKPKLNSLLDVVALGTVADVVTLDYNNRTLVQAGLDMINRGYCRPGLKKIFEIKKNKPLSEVKITAMDFGFVAGPCLNAAGRLEDMSLGIRCLLERNEHIAEEIATRLVDLNEQRKEIEGEMVSEALTLVGDIDPNKDGLTLYEGSWHEGVVGIVASRIKDRMNRPIICFTDTHEASKVKQILQEAKTSGASKEDIQELEDQLKGCDMKGSARSIKGVHLKHALDHIFKTHTDIMVTSNGHAKFGGHAMAAGISLKLENYEKFQKLFDSEIKKQITKEMRVGAIEVDIKDVPSEYLTVENADLINSLGPWGQNFEFPVFSKKMTVHSLRPVGEKKNHLQLELIDPESGKVFKAISFGCIDNGVLPTRENNLIEVSFKIDVNEWRGNRSLQLMIDFMQDEQMILENKLKSDLDSSAPQLSDAPVSSPSDNFNKLPSNGQSVLSRLEKTMQDRKDIEKRYKLDEVPIF